MPFNGPVAQPGNCPNWAIEHLSLTAGLKIRSGETFNQLVESPKLSLKAKEISSGPFMLTRKKKTLGSVFYEEAKIQA